VFIVPNSFFFASGQQGKARQTLERLGIRVATAIELPAGTFHPYTSIPTHIVILKNTTDTTLFTGKYSPDPKHQKEQLKNFNSRASGTSPSLGRLVPTSSFRGFSVIESTENMQEQSRRMGLVPYPFNDVVLELNSPSSKKDFVGFQDKLNSVYLPQMASTRATTSQDSLPTGLKSYFQLVINPDIADAEFLAGLLNTPFGQFWRDSLRTGNIIPRIGKKILEESTLYLPPISKRDIQCKVLDCYHNITRLKSELDELGEKLWKRPSEIDKVQSSLRTVNREDRFQDWIDTLPFPLASVLWVCHAQAGSYREQYERKIQFFEALAEFLAILYLSAFTTNSMLWSDMHDKLKETLAKNKLSLEMATFGTWKTVIEVLSAETRRILNDELELCYELYKTRNREILNIITSKRLIGVLQDANSIRNDWMGHTGAVRESDARMVNEKLTDHIETVRKTFRLDWEGYELIMPGDCKVKAGVYHYTVKKIMGSRTPFASETVDLIEAMEDGHLHIKSPDEGRTLKILPLIKVMPSPRTEENACYFYNRQQKDGIRFLSYHFENDADVVQEFADTAEALRKLT
jgi:hypothetical protein